MFLYETELQRSLRAFLSPSRSLSLSLWSDRRIINSVHDQDEMFSTWKTTSRQNVTAPNTECTDVTSERVLGSSYDYVFRVWVMICPSWSALQALTSAPHPTPTPPLLNRAFSHTKVPLVSFLCPLFSSAGDSTWRNGCRDCNRDVHSFSLKDRTGWWQKNKSILHKCGQLVHSLPTLGNHECSSALPLKERLRMWFLNCSISSGFCCWICCANCCPLKKNQKTCFQSNSVQKMFR